MFDLILYLVIYYTGTIRETIINFHEAIRRYGGSNASQGASHRLSHVTTVYTDPTFVPKFVVAIAVHVSTS